MIAWKSAVNTPIDATSSAPKESSGRRFCRISAWDMRYANWDGMNFTASRVALSGSESPRARGAVSGLLSRFNRATVAAVSVEGLSPLVRNKALAAGAEAWLDELPALVAVLERVSTRLLCTRIELQPVGREMLAVADRVSAPERMT